ncbi:hypothetical protein BVY04_01630 [bacterium M21]|nr:hypothetical protein BVY04_01630 [bacterium M21]
MIRQFMHKSVGHALIACTIAVGIAAVSLAKVSAKEEQKAAIHVLTDSYKFKGSTLTLKELKAALQKDKKLQETGCLMLADKAVAYKRVEELTGIMTTLNINKITVGLLPTEKTPTKKVKTIDGVQKVIIDVLPDGYKILGSTLASDQMESALRKEKTRLLETGCAIRVHKTAPNQALIDLLATMGKLEVRDFSILTVKN